MARIRRKAWKRGKLRSRAFPRPHPTITAREELKRAVWRVAPRTWARAKFICYGVRMVVNG